MNKQDILNEKARAAIDKKAVYGADVDLNGFVDVGQEDAPVSNLTDLPAEKRKQFEAIGLDTSGTGRAGTYMQMDHTVSHCDIAADGVEIMSTDAALKCHEWLMDYWWRAVAPDADKYTARAALHQEHGYFIRASGRTESEGTGASLSLYRAGRADPGCP